MGDNHENEEGGQRTCFERIKTFGPVVVPIALMCRNPVIFKVVVAGGLQTAAQSVTSTFCLSILQGEYWGVNQARYGSLIGVAVNIVATVFGGPFGRFSDRIDRRIAFALMSIGSYLPSWALLLFGWSARSLWASQIALIIGCAPTAANVPIAMLTDVTDVDDREIATGAYFAFSNLVSFLFNAIPALLFNVLDIPGSEALKEHPRYFLFYSVVLQVLSLLCLFVIPNNRKPSEDPGEALPRTKLHFARNACGKAKKELVSPVLLVAQHSRLRPLCTSAFLLGLSGGLVMCIGGTYYNESLGLLPWGTPQQFQDVQLMTMLPGQLLVLPGYLVTAALAKAGGTLKLMRILIPVTALLLLLGTLLKVCPHMWFLPIVVIAESYTGLTNVPLMRMVSGVAPPGRTGEALAACGVSIQMAGFVSNLLVMGPGQFVVASAQRHHSWHILWLYYPVCSLIHLAALLPILGQPSTGRWGAASGRAHDQQATTLAAVRAAARWRNKVRERNNSESEARAMEAQIVESEESTSEDSSSEHSSESSSSASDEPCRPAS